jgi:two-component system chemotaxis response regulator CheY
MKTLIVEDDFTSRLLLQRILLPYGEAHVAVDGEEAITAFRSALKSREPYDLVCLDIMMPRKDGHAVLKELREAEAEKGVSGLDGAKVVMISALGDSRNVLKSFGSQCEAYIVKPLDMCQLIKQLRTLGLIDDKEKEKEKAS